MINNKKIIYLLILTFMILFLVGFQVSACDCSDPENGLTEEDIKELLERALLEDWSFTVGKNPATNYSLDCLCGLELPEDWWVNAPFDPCISSRDLPDYFDWRDYNGCTIVKAQGGCGSCWAFSAIGALECSILIKDNISVDLSEQYLVSDCCTSCGDCGGGWYYTAWNYMMENSSYTDSCGDSGAVLEQDFPYQAQDSPCGCPYPHPYFIERWSFIGSGSSIPPVDSIKQAIIDYGPVSVAVTANSAMQAYNGGIFNGCTSGSINHAVVLVGWDDNQGTDGVWFMRNSWGTGWGEDGGYMRIPYDCSNIGYAAAYLKYRDPITFKLPYDLPDTFLPGVSTEITIQIDEIADTYVPNSGLVHYRYDDGDFITMPLVNTGGEFYIATLPPATCGDFPEFYFTAEGVNTGTISLPLGSPEIVFSLPVGILTPVFSDNFQTDKGWTVINDPGLTDGAWERGMPVGGGDRGDPPSDYDGSGYCYLTDNVDGNSDVDDGITWLISPTLDLSGDIDARISFALWYTNNFGNDPNNDIFNIYVSNDDGTSWVLVESVGPLTMSGWQEHSFMIGDFINPTNQIKIRFEASDLNDGSVVEAGIDDFHAATFDCIDTGSGFISTVSTNWNFISTTFNQSVAKTNIILHYDGQDHTWYEGVTEGVISDFIFGWDRDLQSYNFCDALNPGFGYWIYAFESCSLKANNTAQNSDPFITNINWNWNIIGLPISQYENKSDIIITYNDIDYSWFNAVYEGYVSDFIFGWDRDGQYYNFANTLMPGYAYWVYAYQPCTLKRT